METLPKVLTLLNPEHGSTQRKLALKASLWTT